MCSKDCYHLPSCFNCSGYYDLETDLCLGACSGVVLEGGDYLNLWFCWGNNYYVDSSSGLSVELGSLKYPYKSMKAAMAEIYNLWNTNTSANVSILIHEDTFNFFERGFFRAIQMAQVRITTYSLKPNVVPNRCKMKIVLQDPIPYQSTNFIIPTTFAKRPLNVSSFYNIFASS